MSDTQAASNQGYVPSDVSAYVCVAFMILGFVGATVSFCARNWITFSICGAIVIIAGIVDLATEIMGNTSEEAMNRPPVRN